MGCLAPGLWLGQLPERAWAALAPSCTRQALECYSAGPCSEGWGDGDGEGKVLALQELPFSCGRPVMTVGVRHTPQLQTA